MSQRRCLVVALLFAFVISGCITTTSGKTLLRDTWSITAQGDRVQTFTLTGAAAVTVQLSAHTHAFTACILDPTEIDAWRAGEPFPGSCTQANDAAQVSAYRDPGETSVAVRCDNRMLDCSISIQIHRG